MMFQMGSFHADLISATEILHPHTASASPPVFPRGAAASPMISANLSADAGSTSAIHLEVDSENSFTLSLGPETAERSSSAPI